MDLQRFALALGASAAIATGVARSASTYDQYGVEDMLAHLPQIQSEHPLPKVVAQDSNRLAHPHIERLCRS